MERTSSFLLHASKLCPEEHPLVPIPNLHNAVPRSSILLFGYICCAASHDGLHWLFHG